ncbi:MULTISPECIES: Zn-ribbon domain-containing OB-fold protein [unclassified Sphingomonas]|uniref:Zn-ribbon domain-containing OB-fold protein n=1 Tax=unclassified Sphingomonas TaxID=196159 RepID=UPI0008313430|nr:MULTISPECIES: OB-fold domain-containing protein [unclassified Sphingomonas]
MALTGKPVAEGLFTTGSDGPRLIGSHCEGCGTDYFPTAIGCRNPACHDKRIVATELAPRGTLLSYTVQRYQPPPLFRMDDWAPYAIGLVDLGGGVEVMSMLTGFDLDEIVIGSAVQLTLEPLFTDAQGETVLTYKFAPATAQVPA